MDLLTHYKDFYHFEIQRSEVFDNRLQAPTAALIVLIGFLAYVFEKINFSGEPVGVAMFGLPYLFSTIITCVSVYFLKSAWGGSKYEYLPLPRELEEYRKVLKKHYEEDDSGENVIATYKQTMTEYYIKCASFNSEVNEARARKLYLGVLAMSVASVLALISCIPYYSYNLELEKPTKIELVSDKTSR
ncbi:MULTISPECIES: hypothetical protein [Aliivibrio]|uniref:Uncharacterized protein n=1 Tax=Aliivibrio finisterrensis TaxID=511998 RepID=A0A4Q5KN01_9GAMM|nr:MULTISPECIES: hypothetical protein [Aliivibrio]MDD9180654.1 hypothetical protein [Aliivibrio sp. A6]RYU47119.1 hypothetical protein ERW57_18680 [Aliivibrio finisterrensis]RYU48225.1 hypothetical protein ERW56_18845 [Aliivibrio finisterrensis]RYU52731.1 hypothetical protein ERW50_19025 [Aliivibrio finisterrensis]RYU59588.1 hypothetical protein ERW53_19875 [Aliivibrio finisterrensis]